MADTSRTVRVRFDGSAAGLSRASRQAEKDLERFRAKANSFREGAIKFGAITGLVGAVGSLGGPAVAGGIAALGSLGVAGGVVALAFSGVGDAVEEFNKALESGDYTEYEKALARMPKSQAEFTRELVKTKQEFGRLKTTAADNTLPGISDALRGSIGLLPILDRGVARTGKLISDTGHDLGELFATEEFKKDLDGFLKAVDPVTDAVGDSLVDLTGRLVKFGSEMAPASQGFASFLRGMTDGVTGFLDELAPHADDFKLVWESLGDIVREILPIAGSFIGDLSETWGPVLRDVADWLAENRDEITEWGGAVARATPYLLAVAAALKGLGIARDISGALSLARGALGLFGGAARDADGKTRGFSDRLGGLKMVAGGLALGAIAKGLDEINVNAAGGEQNLQGFEENLHDIVGAAEQILRGDFGGIFTDIGSEWNEMVRNMQGNNKIDFDVNTGPAREQVQQFMGALSGTVGTVNINGRTEDASQALAEIIQRIDNGNGEVTVNGTTLPADQHLRGLIDQINRSGGTVMVNGNPVPAGQALFDFLTRVNNSRASVGVGANTSNAQGVIDGFITRNDGRQIRIFTSVLGSGGIASAGRLATGGPVRGPGSGTSDTAGLFALSNGEHVWTAAEVAAAGGHAALMRMRQAVLTGQFRGLATGGPVDRSYMSSASLTRTRSVQAQASSGGDTSVHVYIDGQEFRGIVRTEIEQDNRNTRRLVGSGAGRGF